jgi:proline iminopeptidase
LRAVGSKRIVRTEGKVNVLGFDLFYRVFAPPVPRGTIVCLHGGPGATHDYLLPLRDLAKSGWRVVFYDQLGCGRSEMPKNYALFTVERAVDELEAFRSEMKLGKVHLMGSSYGGMLALAYALKYQKNLKSLITTGGLANVPLTIAEMQRLKSELPPAVVRVMDRYEAKGDYENPNYEKAVMVFYKKHLLRRKNWPKDQLYTMTHMSKPVYGTMNGPNEFTIIGNIRYWDITEELHNIRVPTLVTGGKYDEVTPKVARSIHDHIRGSKLVIFEKSSHLAMWEERGKYMRTLDRFMNSAAGR